MGGDATKGISRVSVPRTAVRTTFADAPPVSPRKYPVHCRHAKSPIPVTGEQSDVDFALEMSAADAGDMRATDSAVRPLSDLLE
jgi:hypothetical protein